MATDKDHIALFIDCDNISHKAIEGIISELSNYGVVNIRQAYGNWTKSNLKNWEAKLLEFAIKPIQQFDYSKQKNATDILMTIDAIDMLHTKKIDAFAFATSDSDFTPVVMRVQQEGIKVFGFGEKKTPAAFMAACSQFIFTEKLMATNEASTGTGTSKSTAVKAVKEVRKTSTQLQDDTWLRKLLANAQNQTMDEFGWSNLADMGAYINNKSSFSPINYGYKKLSTLLKVMDVYDLYLDKESKQMSVRCKNYTA
ncbi:MAG TPA: NYN domain-containing protein [Campylobacterales bacterium]|nr:NYN domain-containing protein [Campylobacterales bacterium]